MTRGVETLDVRVDTANEADSGMLFEFEDLPMTLQTDTLAAKFIPTESGQEELAELGIGEVAEPQILGLVDDPDRELKQMARDPGDYADLPDELRPNVYGNRVIAPIRLGDLIMVDQTRRGRNSEESRIAQSIEQNGLINIPEVALLDADAFRAYLNVVYYRKYGGHMPNEVFEQYSPRADGRYALVVSGHTRTRGMIANEKKRAKKAKEVGYDSNPYDAITYVNVEEGLTPEEILARQIAENFHSSPPTEDIALVTVSHYKYLRDTGKIHSQEDYVSMVGGSLSPDILAGMLAYSKLPERVHDLVGEKALPLSVAIELAKLRERKMLLVGLDVYGYEFATQVGMLDSDQTRGDKVLLQVIDDADFAKIDAVVEQWLVHQAGYLYNKRAADAKFSTSKQKAFVQALNKQVEQDITTLSLPALVDLDENMEVMHGTLPGRKLSGREGLKATAEKLARDLAKLTREIEKNPLDKVDAVAKIVRGLGCHSVERAVDDERVRAAMGRIASALQVSDRQMAAMYAFVDQSQQ